MERFFIIDKYNSWFDWKCILTEKIVDEAEPKTNFVSIDGKSGSLDLSEALTGEVSYNDRVVSASFWTSEGTRDEREKLLRDIRKSLHGKKVKIVEPDDPEHYFIGRVVMGKPNNILPYAEFTLTATCEPWRYKNEETVRQITVNSTERTDLVITNNGVKTISPIVTVVGNVVIYYENMKTGLTSGSYRLPDVKCRCGTTIVGVSGNGTVTLTYQEADL